MLSVQDLLPFKFENWGRQKRGHLKRNYGCNDLQKLEENNLKSSIRYSYQLRKLLAGSKISK